MKQFFLTFFLFTISATYGQSFSIKGRVTDEDTHKTLYKGDVRMVGSDGSDVTVSTDSTGNYFFDSSKLRPNTSYILSASGARIEYLASANKANISTVGLNDTKVFVVDFELERVTICVTPQLPTVRFEKGISILTKGNKDTALVYIIRLMNANPTYVLEFDAHASNDEGNKQQKLDLSIARARACKDYVVSQGVDSVRIFIKGWGDTKPILHSSEIDIPIKKNKEQRKAANIRNRRCEFRFLRFDYKK